MLDKTASTLAETSEDSLVGIAMHSRLVRSERPMLGCCIQLGNSKVGERRSDSAKKMRLDELYDLKKKTDSQFKKRIRSSSLLFYSLI